MKLQEYAAKQLLVRAGLPVPGWSVADTVDQARDQAAGYLAAGADKVVIKAQVLVGGRGKAGGVRLAGTADEAASVEAITRECVLYGSPRTVLDKLVAFRDEVGPFGTLLMTGLDWGGPNAAWERESMRLLAQEVMPKFRQHVLGGRRSDQKSVAMPLTSQSP